MLRQFAAQDCGSKIHVAEQAMRPSVVSVADRVVLLRGGQVQADGPRDAVLATLKSAA